MTLEEEDSAEAKKMGTSNPPTRCHCVDLELTTACGFFLWHTNLPLGGLVCHICSVLHVEEDPNRTLYGRY